MCTSKCPKQAPYVRLSKNRLECVSVCETGIYKQTDNWLECADNCSSGRLLQNDSVDLFQVACEAECARELKLFADPSSGTCSSECFSGAVLQSSQETTCLEGARAEESCLAFFRDDALDVCVL